MFTKKCLLFLLLLASTLPALTQTDTTAIQIEEENKLFDRVEVEASFPGGNEAWRKYLEKTLNSNVPVDRGAPAGKYTVIVQFVVAKDGSITDARALTFHGFGMEQEVLRVIRIGPKWTPAEQNGRIVKAYRRQPVTFVIQEEKKKKKNKD